MLDKFMYKDGVGVKVDSNDSEELLSEGWTDHPDDKPKKKRKKRTAPDTDTVPATENAPDTTE